MPELVPCNLCGHDDTRFLFRLRDYRLQVDDHEWTTVRCRSCGLGYLNPRPTVQEVARYYPDSYFNARKSHIGRYRRLARYVSGPPGRLLDVGTARGDFLALMRDRGWEVEGIEPFDAENPHDVPIHRVPFPGGAGIPAGSFDVITAWAVFEHLHDPGAAFEVCARLLSPDGRLIVQVPNLRSIHSRWAMQEDVPRHIYFFTPRTLRRYAAKSGLVLTNIHHTTDLFGGSGRGVLRLALIRALRRSVSDYFEIARASRRQRFQRWPLIATAWTAVSALERLFLPDWLVRRLRVSGQIVAEFRRMSSGA